MLNDVYEGVMVPGLDPKEKGYPGLDPRRETVDGLVIDYDVAIGLRDGVTIYADIYRSADLSGPFPAMLLWSAYGKHYRWSESMLRAFTDGADVSRHAPIECPDPAVWCPLGFAIVVPDPRGMFGSEGDDATAWSPEEGEDIHDTIEWIAEQEWCSGKVGMAGASYFAIVQWFAGATRPPHLAALMPYDGMSDLYREIAFHGGIPNGGFVSFWNTQRMQSMRQVEDWDKAMELHPFLDDYWKTKIPEVEKITVPTYVIASWTDHGVHTRGSLSAFMRLGSEQKWLEVHGRNKWARLYDAESVRRQIAFFDRFLKSVENEVDGWPRVRIEIREGMDRGVERAEAEWPLARTDHRSFFLDAARGVLSTETVERESSVSYDATSVEPQALFSHTFSADTELTGYFKLKLWVEADGADDMDLFTAVQKLDAAGQLVNFYYITRFRFGHAAHGWLRASHRELDPQGSTPEQPVHLHRREERLNPGEIVPVEVEIWPSSTLFRAGEQMRLVVLGRDPFPETENAGIAFHPETRNACQHIIHTGGRYDSHLLVPIIPQ